MSCDDTLTHYHKYFERPTLDVEEDGYYITVCNKYEAFVTDYQLQQTFINW